MTTQDAGRQAGGDKADIPKGGDKGSLDPDEAERLASMIRPAWELDLVEGELSAPSPGEPAAAAPAAPVITEAAAAAVAAPRPVAPQVTPPLGTPQLGTPADRASAERLSTNRLTDGGVDPSIAAGTTASLLPRDTVIDGAPMVNVGDRSSQDTAARTSVAAAIQQGIDIVDRGAKVAADGRPPDARPLAAPVRAGPTKLGLGEGVADIIAKANAEEDAFAATTASAEGQQIVARGVPTAAMTEVVLAPPAGAPRKGGTIRMADANAIAELHAVSPPVAVRPSSSPSPALEPVAPQGASFSRADDPIELPVQKSSSVMLVVIGLVVVVGAIVGGVLLLGGSDTPEKKTTSEARSSEDTPKAGATATTRATETSSPTTSAATSASATATASASASASAAPTAKPTADPPPSTAKPPRTAPPKTTGAPPKPGPKPTSTGIIRDTPF